MNAAYTIQAGAQAGRGPALLPGTTPGMAAPLLPGRLHRFCLQWMCRFSPQSAVPFGGLCKAETGTYDHRVAGR